MENSAPRPNNFEEAFAQKIAAETIAAKNPNSEANKKKREKKALKIIIIVASILILLGLLAYFLFFFDSSPVHLSWFDPPESKEETELSPAEKTAPETPKENLKKYYSTLSGEEISAETENSSPTFCVQIPNGVDGARPQAGLNDAKVVFEAIAEAGITRFAAIFQNPTATAIGPIRSLRIYYFDWDSPFDCTVTHAGGAPDAISALNSSTLGNLDENYTYMWRSDANASLNRLWNNLFTSSELLKKYSEDKSRLSSDVSAFPRWTPEESELEKIKTQVVEKLDIDSEASGDTDELSPKITKISLDISYPTFNPVYTYNKETNSYDRSYASGVKHEVYNCTEENVKTPEVDCGGLVQLSPKVVIAMMVQEGRQSDNYHEDISTVGAGDAYIFENGTVIEGTWEKSSKNAQIIFRDKDNYEIKLNPGQTWITAVPVSYGGSVTYE